MSRSKRLLDIRDNGKESERYRAACSMCHQYTDIPKCAAMFNLNPDKLRRWVKDKLSNVGNIF